MALETKFVFVAGLEERQLGEISPKLPPHITIVPPFKVYTHVVPNLLEGFNDVVEENQGLRLMALHLDRFGDDGSISVRRVSGFGLEFGIHAAATALVKRWGGEFDETYTGLNWRPHVTEYDSLPERSELSIRQFQLYRKLVSSKGWLTYGIFSA